jgi:Domain of unknown function (DUF4129)
MRSPRELLILLLLVCMEMTAGFAVIVGSSLLDVTALQYAMFWILLASAVVGLTVALLVINFGPGDPWNRLGLVAGAALGAGAPAALVSHNWVSFAFALFLLLIAYWRGIAVAQNRPSHEEVMGRFGVGFALLFVGLVWVVARGIDSHRSVWQMLAFLGIGYTILTFVALVLARVERDREPGSGQAIMLAVAAQLVVILIVAVGALQVFSYDVVGAAMQHTQPFWNALGATVYRFVTLIADPIQWFINLIRPPGRRSVSSPPAVNPLATTAPIGSRPREKPKGSPAVVIAAIIFAVMVGAAILCAVWFALPRLPHRSRRSGYTEERRNLSLAEMWRLVMSWIHRLLSRSALAAADAVQAGRRRLLPDLPADPVRRVYVQVLRRAAASGVRREPGMTPTEFRVRLATAWPAGADDFSGLTQAYVRRRYGEVTLEHSEVTRVREQWHRLRTVMRVRHREPEAISTSAAPAQADHVGRRHLRLPRLRDIIRLPEPPFGEQPPRFSRSVLEAIMSFIIPILLVAGVLVLLAIISHTAGK